MVGITIDYIVDNRFRGLVYIFKRIAIDFVNSFKLQPIKLCVELKTATIV